jgi:hypothetical protein
MSKETPNIDELVQYLVSALNLLDTNLTEGKAKDMLIKVGKVLEIRKTEEETAALRGVNNE